MIIFRTSADTIHNVVKLSKHALASQPKLSEGELILISQTITDSTGSKPPIRYIMEFVRIYEDLLGESNEIWGRQWRYIIEGKNCRRLKRPFNIGVFQVSNQNYAQGGPYVYVLPEDEEIIREKGLLETS